MKRKLSRRKAALAKARRSCSDLVFEGFESPDWIRGDTQDQLRRARVPKAAQWAIDITSEELRRHRLEQLDWWRAETDNDRLDRAFQELNQKGITAKQHYKCCPPCAEYALANTRGNNVYFHEQDTARARREKKLNLRVARFLEDDEKLWSVVREVLKTHSFELKGAGDARWIEPFIWRRRRMCYRWTCNVNNKRATWPCFGSEC